MPLDQIEENTNSQNREMTFFDHLEELRWHLIRSVVAILVFTVAAFLFITPIFDYIILAPTKASFLTYGVLCDFSNWAGLGETFCIAPTDFGTIQNIDLPGQFLMSLKISMIIGFILAFPYAAWETWRFVKPALYDNERKYARGIVFFVSLLFFMGVFFGYFVLTPFSVNFFANYKISETIVNQFKITSYIQIVSTVVLAAGIMFQLPMVVYFLSKLGLLTPQIMRDYRRHAVVVILTVAAIITPADIWTQVLVFFPVYFLYEISIFLSARIERERKEEMD